MTAFLSWRKVGLALVLTLGLVSLAGCSVLSAEETEIRVGLIAPLSGDLAGGIGKPTLEAAQLAVQEVNQAGGLEIQGGKQKVTLVVEDNKDQAETSVAAAQKLINQENVVALIGPQLSRNTIPVARLAEQAHIPMIAPTSTNSETTAGKKYVFRTVFRDDFQGQVMARFAIEELEAQKAAVLYDIASAYNKDIAKIFRGAFEELGGRVVAFESYTTGEQDFSRQLAQVKVGRPDIIFLPNYYSEVPRQVQQIRQMGLEARIIGTDSWNGLSPAAREMMEGAFFSNHYALDLNTPRNQAFIKAYRGAYNHLPTGTAAATYDAFKLLFQAIQNQGQADPESIRAGLAGIESYTGITGVMRFYSTGDPVMSAVILQIKGGDFVYYRSVEPRSGEGGP